MGAQPVMVRLLPSGAAAIDRWRAAQPDHPGRPEAIRRLIEVALAGPNKQIPTVSIGQVKAARAILGWSQEELADAAGVSIPTIKRLEAHDGPLGGRDETGTKIRSALEGAGVEFIDENGGGPGVRLRKQR